MLLSGALFALFMMGFWLYCLTDVILTPAAECRGLRKPTWIALICVTFIGGAPPRALVRAPVGSSTPPPPRTPPRGPDRPPPPPHDLFCARRWHPAGKRSTRRPRRRGRAADP